MHLFYLYINASCIDKELKYTEVNFARLIMKFITRVLYILKSFLVDSPA